MKLFQRITDIISANLHDMMDRFEDPEVMLKQAIREMEESLDTVNTETAKALAGQKRLTRERSKNELESLQWQQRAVQAVQNNDDDLARRALARKRECDSLVKALSEQEASVSVAVESLKNQLAAMRAKHAEAKRHLTGLLIRKKAADIRKQSLTALDPKVAAPFSSNAFRKFDRLREKVEDAEAEAEALAELSALAPETGVLNHDIATDGSLDGEYLSMDIESELQRLKSKKE